MYTLRDFRANTKKAFDDAAQGHEVVIERGNQRFQLVSLVNEPLSGSLFESTSTSIIKKPSDIFTRVTVTKRCQHKLDPTTCMFAKPGKPCK